MTYFENLKNSIVTFFSKKGKKSNIEKQIKLDKGTDQEETVSLMMDEKPKFVWHHKSYNAIKVFSTSRLPYLYGTFAIFTLAFMLILSYRQRDSITFFSEIGPLKVKYLSMFDLPRVNYLIFHMINTCTGLSGLALVCSVYISLQIKMTSRSIINRDSYQNLKLYVAIIYGVISNILQVIYGLTFLIEGIDKINGILLKEIYISLPQFLFFVEIFFSVLFGIFTTFIVHSLKLKPAYSISQGVTEDTRDKDDKWVNYKILCIVYLIFFTFIWTFVHLHSNNIILETLNTQVLKLNYSYLLAFLPYLLYLINASLYVMFYDELRNSDITLIDLKRSEEVENNYENNIKNIL